MRAAKCRHFNTCSFLGRSCLKDVSSFGMRSVALPLPDVILFDWGSNSRDCFWGAVNHNCACAAAKLSRVSFFFFFLSVAVVARIHKNVNTTKIQDIFVKYYSTRYICIHAYTGG